MLKKLRSINKGSAAGPTGIRASHILNAIQVNNQTSVLDTLTSFVNFLAKGNAPLEVQPYLAGAFLLIGLGKKKWWYPTDCNWQHFQETCCKMHDFCSAQRSE